MSRFSLYNNSLDEKENICLWVGRTIHHCTHIETNNELQTNERIVTSQYHFTYIKQDDRVEIKRN